jgi:hypothetical protein
MVGFAVIAVFSLIGIVAVFAWVGVVSVGIRRDDHGAVLNSAAVGAYGTRPGPVSRIASQTTGMHWIRPRAA